MIPAPLDDLMKALARLPGVGRRSAQRAALHLLTNPEQIATLSTRLETVSREVKTCTTCGNLSLTDPCHLCTDPKRDSRELCVVESVADLWAMERSHAFHGRYFVLGGVMSAMEGRGPDDIGLPRLLALVESLQPAEVILALSAGVDGQTTSHLIAHKLQAMGLNVSTLAKGLPMGAELDYMDDGTLVLALQGRRHIGV